MRRAARVDKVKQPKKLSVGEELLALQMQARKLTGFVREYIFAPPRRWRADFAFIDLRILIEVEGGVWGGRHTTGTGFTADCEKYNAAAIDGWMVLRYTTAMVKSGIAEKQIYDAVMLKSF